MANTGIKIGSNLNTNTDLQLKLTTKYAALKILSWDDTSLTTNGSGNATKTIAHNLDYSPAFQVFRKDTASWSFMDASSYPNAFLPVGGANYWSSDNLHHAIHTYSDEDNLYIQVVGGEPSKTMNFRYYILADVAQDFGGSGGPALTNDVGFKWAKPDVNVFTGQEYEMKHSSKYKSLQYYQQYRRKEDLTLPIMFTSHHDDFEEEGTYVDFLHNFDFPPFFLAFFEADDGLLYQIPYNQENSLEAFNYMVTGFCDADRVRLSFWRSSTFFITLLDSWPAETITIKVIIFDENLAGETS
jgi:hypothetical protein